MNQYLEDAFLYRYIPEAEAAMLAAIPPEGELGHSFSRRFRSITGMSPSEYADSVKMLAEAGNLLTDDRANNV